MEGFSLDSAFVVVQPNWGSRIGHYEFDEDDNLMNKLVLHPSSVVIFDIKQYNIKTKLTQDYGFAIYPMTQKFQDRVYMISGVMQLPVYLGRPSSTLV